MGWAGTKPSNDVGRLNVITQALPLQAFWFRDTLKFAAARNAWVLGACSGLSCNRFFGIGIVVFESSAADGFSFPPHAFHFPAVP
jgi:hypothetical protein